MRVYVYVMFVWCMRVRLRVSICVYVCTSDQEDIYAYRSSYVDRWDGRGVSVEHGAPRDTYGMCYGSVSLYVYL